MKFFFALIFLSVFSLGLLAQSDMTERSPVREGVFTIEQQVCDSSGKGMFSLPEYGEFGSPQGTASTIYISNDTLASVKTSSLSSQALKTILIPEDSCIYFILDEKPICFEKHQSQNMSLVSSKNGQEYEHIKSDGLEIEGFSTILFREYIVDSSGTHVVVDSLHMWGTTEIKSSFNMLIEDDKTYDVFPLKYVLQSQYGCFVMELTKFEKAVPRGVFDIDRSKIEYYYNMEEYMLLGRD
jgi:hypothetical protein